MRPVIIYALVDPRDKAIRYIGKTVRLKARLSAHCHPKDGDQSYRARWVRQLFDEDLAPWCIVLEEASESDWVQREQSWIAIARDYGAPLTNLTAGGEGVVGFQRSPDSIAKQVAKQQGRPRPPEFAVKVAAALRGHPVSTAARKKMSAGHQGQQHRSTGSLPYIGVYLDRHTGLCRARICCDGIRHHLGCFHSIEEAARAYDRAALELFGPIARLNFPDEAPDERA